MAAILPLLERLPALHARLVAAGLAPDPPRWIAVNDLLLKLYAQGRFPNDVDELRSLLAPLLCSSRTQQDDFLLLYRHWAEAESGAIKPLEVGASVEAERGFRDYLQATKRWPLALLGLALLLAVAFGGPALQRYFNPEQPTPIQEERSLDKETKPDPGATDEKLPETGLKPLPIPPRSPAERFQLPTDLTNVLEAARYVCLALPGLLILLYCLDRKRRLRAILKQQANDPDDPLRYLPLPPSNRMPFWGGQVPRVLHRLRRGAWMVTRRIDVERTVEATIRDGGLFRPRWLRRRWRPEYLLLIERRHGWDHVADLGHALADRLEKDGLAVYRYEFRGNPGHCIETTPAGPRSRRLQALQSRHPHARIIALGDADGLFDPLTGAPLEAVFQSLRFWPGRAWLTTRAQPWGQREAVLAQAGFAVAPLLGAGVVVIADWLESPSSAGLAPWFEPIGTEAYPPMLRFDSRQWLQDRDPPADLEATLRALRAYLGQQAMDLLTAMAAYPGMHLGLTMVLDQKLFPEQRASLREQRLLRLSRLPWCRYGHMPDYLRERLLVSLDATQRDRVRESYHAILREQAGTVTTPVSGPWYLPFVFQRNRSWLRQLRDRLRFAPPDSPLSDRIFAKLLLEPKRGVLDFELPKQLVKDLRMPGAGWAGAALAVTLALAGAWAVDKTWDRAVIPLAEARAKQQNAQYPVSVFTEEGADEALGNALRTAVANWGFPPNAAADTAKINDLARTMMRQLRAINEVRGDREPSKPRPRVVYAAPSASAAAQRIAERLRYLSYSRLEVDVVQEAALARVDAQAILVLLFDAKIPAGGVFRDRLTGTYTQPASQAAQSATDKEATKQTVEPLEPELVDIPAGKFRMGSQDNEPGRSDDEGPQHDVSIAAFQLGKYEVTFDEYDRYVQDQRLESPSDYGWGRGKRPVINVSWNDAQAYAQWLSQKTGKNYRLPSEAEWEYAARAGTPTPFSTGNCLSGEQANIDATKAYASCPVAKDYVRKTREVGQYPANAFGLHDLHGNVWESTQDCWHADYKNAPSDGTAWEQADKGACGARVVRGGSWNGTPGNARSAYRYWNGAVAALIYQGFRLARTK